MAVGIGRHDCRATAGSGKTVLAQQLCFHNASPKRRVLYFNTLSEPAAKTLRKEGMRIGEAFVKATNTAERTLVVDKDRAKKKRRK